MREIECLLKSAESALRDVKSSIASPPTVQMRAAELKLRRARDSVFPTDYFGEPAWDMLLELDAAEQAGQRLVVSDVGMCANIPPTTSLRYLARFEADGLINRHTDPRDRRRIFVSLTAKSRAALGEVFTSVAA